MGAEGAVNIIFKDAIAGADDPDAERARLVADYEARVRESRTSRRRAATSTRSSCRARRGRA